MAAASRCCCGDCPLQPGALSAPQGGLCRDIRDISLSPHPQHCPGMEAPVWDNNRSYSFCCPVPPVHCTGGDVAGLMSNIYWGKIRCFFWSSILILGCCILVSCCVSVGSDQEGQKSRGGWGTGGGHEDTTTTITCLPGDSPHEATPTLCWASVTSALAGALQLLGIYCDFWRWQCETNCFLSPLALAPLP